MIIGITGKKRRGKNSVAEYLSSKYGFKQYALADKVKEMLYATNPLIPVTSQEVYDLKLGGLPTEYSDIHTYAGDGRIVYFFRVQTIVDAIDWEQAKEIVEVRQLLQRVGTEGGRTVFYPEIWIDTLDGKMLDELEEDDDAGISDLRFDNEGSWTKKEWQGVVIKVVSDRPGLPEADAHASETEISEDLVDYVLDNSGTLEELYEKVDELLKRIREDRS